MPRDDSDTRALVDDLTQFINKKRMRPVAGWMLYGGMLWFLIGFIGNIATSIYNIVHDKAYFPALATAVANFAFMMALTIFAARSSQNEVRIIPTKRSEGHWFSRTNRREIAIAVVASVIGAIIIALAGLWAGAFVNH